MNNPKVAPELAQEQPKPELTKHEKKQLKKQEREEQRNEEESTRHKEERAKSLKKYGLYAVVLLILGGAGYGIIQILPEGGSPSTSNSMGHVPSGVSVPSFAVHWHSTIEIVTCGEVENLPRPTRAHIGSPLLHTHDDQLIHLEGLIPNADAIRLSKYTGNIGKNFKNDELLDYKNGDTCPDGTIGTVKLFVDGEQNDLLADYIIQDAEANRLEFS